MVSFANWLAVAKNWPFSVFELRFDPGHAAARKLHTNSVSGPGRDTNTHLAVWLYANAQITATAPFIYLYGQAVIEHELLERHKFIVLAN
jgi:hypothetical protein